MELHNEKYNSADLLLTLECRVKRMGYPDGFTMMTVKKNGYFKKMVHYNLISPSQFTL